LPVSPLFKGDQEGFFLFPLRFKGGDFKPRSGRVEKKKIKNMNFLPAQSG
jgi:hypothetical protein